MKCLFTSDLHGLRQLYAQITGWCRNLHIETLILGGDLLPDAPPAFWNHQVDWIRTQFRAHLRQFRAAGVEQVAFLHGNHDWAGTDLALVELQDAGELILLNNCGVQKLQDLHIVSYAYTPPSPFIIKDFEKKDLPNDPPRAAEFEGYAYDPAAGEPRPVGLEQFLSQRGTIQSDLEGLVLPAQPWILVCHGPPKASGADVLWVPPKSDLPSHLAIDPEKIQHLHVGSAAIGDFIQRHRPMLSLHGHIHEAPYLSGRYVHAIGEAHIVNPGQRRDRAHGVAFDANAPTQTLFHTVWGTADGPATVGETMPPRPSFSI